MLNLGCFERPKGEKALPSLPFLSIVKAIIGKESMSRYRENGLDTKQAQRFWECADSLPDQCMKVLILRKEFNLPQYEIAKRVEISEQCVEDHLANAIKLLIQTSNDVSS